jgi:glycine cleavage system aminomethyltransferase T
LNISPVYDVVGTDAAKLLNYVCVNRDFNTLKIGGSRHALMCNEKGQLMGDGLIVRTGEQSYRTYWLAPVLAYYADTLGLDVKGEWVRDEFFFQIDGPKSLQIMEKAAQQDLHDMKFAQKRNIKIAGVEVTIVRLGMTGCLAYEVHGSWNKADLVFKAILDAGQEFGIKRLGANSYTRSHTAGGYPNQWIHFWYPWFSGSEDIKTYIMESPYVADKYKGYPFFGSANDNIENAFVTPFDVAWDYLIDYNHDFVGKSALQQISKNPPHKCVTLVWDSADIGEYFAAQFNGIDVEPVDDLRKTGDGGDNPFVISKVLDGSKMIGVASSRVHDFYTNRMISLGVIDKEYAEEGKELKVIWGTNGFYQKEIRVKVGPFPYYNEELRNETFDVEKIPRLK